MALSTNGKNVALDGIAAVAVYVSAHTADAPSDAGDNEVTGGSYARQAITWNAASSGNLDNSNTPVIPIPASTTVKSLGLWSAETVGTYYGAANVTDEAFTGAGTYTVTDFDIAAT